MNSGNSTDEPDNNDTGPAGDTDTAPVDSGDTDTSTTSSSAWANVKTTYDADGDSFLTEDNANILLAKITSGDVTDVPQNVTDQITAKEFDQDDKDKISYPGAPEVVDGRDNDGDGFAEVDPTIDATTYSDTLYHDGPAIRVAFGDVDGDGYQDQIMSNADAGDSDNLGEGQIKIFLGPVPGTEPDVVLHGGSYGAGLGGVLAVADFDGDKIADILSTSNPWLGAGIYYGRSDAEWATASEPDAIFTDNNEDFLGGEVMASGDELFLETNNAPIIYHIPQLADSSDGRYSGTQPLAGVSGWKEIFDTTPLSGQLVMTNGDYNGDGIGDVAIANTMGPGTDGNGLVNVYYGPLPTYLDNNPDGPYSASAQSVAYKSFEGENGGDQAGTVMITGNFDGVGGDDLVIGAPVQGGYGRAYVFTGDVLDSLPDGSAGTTTLDGPATAAGATALVANSGDEQFPNALAAGDMDGDGQDDLVLASNKYAGETGGLLWLSGAYLSTLGGQEVSIDETSQMEQTQAYSLKSGFEMGILESPADHLATGDVDKDGAADLLAGVYTGNAYLFHGGYHGN